jgi:hypothetical protein
MKPAAAPCRVALPCTQPRTPRHAPTTRLPHTRHTTGRAQVPHHPVQPAQARREGLQDPQRLPVQLHHVRQLHRRDLGLDPVHARHADGGRRAVHGGGRLPDGGVGARQAQAAGQGVRGPRAGGGGGGPPGGGDRGAVAAAPRACACRAVDHRDWCALYHTASASYACCCCSCVAPAPQLFDGKEGREKYPKRWVMFPPLL